MYPFEACSTFTITGTTGAGKSTWVFNMLKDRAVMFTTPPSRILYCYGVHQPLYDVMKRDLTDFTLHEGLPDSETIDAFCRGNAGHGIILLDDLMNEVACNTQMEKLFTQGAHHRGLSVIYITQNVFAQGRCARTIALNTHYLILFRSMRSASQISHLGSQLHPGKSSILVQAYQDATKEQHVEKRESESKSSPGQGVVENTTPVSTDSVTFDRILQSISKQFRSRAKFIEQSDNKIGWSSQGELTVSGHSVKGSNISELVRHAMKPMFGSNLLA